MGIQDRLAEEANRLLSEIERKGETPTDGELRRFILHRAVLNETLRLYPPAFQLSRQAVVDDQLDGKLVPAGTSVVIGLQAINRDAESWGSDANEFRPERWMEGGREGEGEEGKEGIAMVRSPWSFLSFSGGPRICIGKGFAMQEATLALALLCRNFRFKMKE